MTIPDPRFETILSTMTSAIEKNRRSDVDDRHLALLVLKALLAADFVPIKSIKDITEAS